MLTKRGSIPTPVIKPLIRTLLMSVGYDVVEHGKYGHAPDLLRALFAAHEINCVIDVGGHWGEFGGYLRHFGFTGEIVSFEPVAASYERLKEAARRDPHWQVHRVALGKAAATAAINVTRETVFSSFLKPNAASAEWFGDASAIQNVSLVGVRRLDQLFDEVTQNLTSPRVFLKIDTQGWDMQVVQGAEGILDRVEAMQTEMSVQPIYHNMPSMSDALSKLDRMGFSVAGMYPVTRTPELSVVEFDCILVKRAAAPTGIGVSGSVAADGSERSASSKGGHRPVQVADRR